MAAGQKGEEDLVKNPFLNALRTKFESLYRLAANQGKEGKEASLLVPCAECLEPGSFTQAFVETHILQAARIPGLHTNLLGQGVEIRDAMVSTHLGFSEHRVSEVLQKDSMYESEFSSAITVFVVDKPLIGRYKPLPGIPDKSSPRLPGPAASAAPRLPGAGPAGDPGDWLQAAPAIQSDFVDRIDRFRKTFVQVPGCEQSTAERIRELVHDTMRKLVKHHDLTLSQQRQLDYHVSRHAYAALHSFVFPHLQQILADHEARLERAIRSYPSAHDLVDVVPGARGRSLDLVDVSACSNQLDLLNSKITPHDKIVCIDEARSALQRCVTEHTKAGPRPRDGAVEITGDDVLSLFILAVYGSSFQHRLAHVSHVEMYLQGTAGLSGSEAARFEEGGYAVTALQGALQFFCDEEEQQRSRASAAGGAAPRGGQRAAAVATSTFSNYLQPATGVSAADEELERAGMQLHNLVRAGMQVRSQGRGGR